MPSNAQDRDTAHRPTVFLLDDDQDFCAAVAESLAVIGIPVECYPAAARFLEAYDPERPGCLLLDVRMPGMDGLALQDLLVRRNIRIPTIFVSGHADIPTTVKALKAGAMDFLEKPFNRTQLLDRIGEAFARDAAIRQEEATLTGIRDRYDLLTPREREVMHLVVRGRSNKEVGEVLGISRRTVDVYRAKVMLKMQAKTLPDLVHMAGACAP